MDITDGGPCADIDSSAVHAVGSDYGVGISLIGAGETQLSTFYVDVRYDDTPNLAPQGQSQQGRHQGSCRS